MQLQSSSAESSAEGQELQLHLAAATAHFQSLKAQVHVRTRLVTLLPACYT